LKLVRARFLINEICYDGTIVDALPVGRSTIWVGQTGTPPPHRKTGENWRSSGSKPRRDTATGLSRVERTEGRLPIFQSVEKQLRGDTKRALAEDPCGLSATRSISADRRHQRVGLHRSPD